MLDYLKNSNAQIKGEIALISDNRTGKIVAFKFPILRAAIWELYDVSWLPNCFTHLAISSLPLEGEFNK